MRSEELISRLARDLRPVRRLPGPLALTAAWVALAACVVGTAVLLMGPREDLMAHLAAPDRALPLLAAVATGLLAGFSAFQLALPDRDGRWGLLPLPAVLLWLTGMGWGCLADLARIGPAALRLGASFACFGFITALGLPLTAGIAFMARHAAALRPGPVVALGGLSAAALASVGLSCVHHLDAALMVLAWHGVAVLCVTAVAWNCGPWLLRRLGAAAPRL